METAHAEDSREVPFEAVAVSFLTDASYVNDWPVAVETPAQPWAYAAYLGFPPDAKGASNVRLRIRISRVTGEPWIGVLTRDQRDFVTRTAVPPGDGSREINVGPFNLDDASKIVIENGDRSDSSSLVIESASMLVASNDPCFAIRDETVPSSANNNGLRAASRFPVKTVRLGRHQFAIRGISEDDPYFAGLCDDYEVEFQGFCRRFIPSNAICIDVGANIGVKSLFLSRHARKGRVIAIEAAPGVAKFLEANIAANHAENVECVKSAIGDHVGTVRFSESSAYGHIASKGVEVPMTTLDELARRFEFPRIDFIKIDVEGFEFPILRSAYNLINHYRSLVLFEFNSWCQIAFADVNPKAFLTWIFDNFRHVMILKHGGRAGDLVQEVHKEQLLYILHENLLREGCVTDFIVTNEPKRL